MRLKTATPRINLVKCCCLFGVTRQAYYQHFWQTEALSFEQGIVLTEVRKIRKVHPVIGGKKLYVLLQPFLLGHQIKMGRDALFNLLSAHYLLVRKTKRRIFTTQSFHWLRKYPNCIREIVPTKVNEIWVSDITYYRTEQGFVYISLITDAYSKKIVGYHAADTLETIHTLSALQMAIKQNAAIL